MKSIMADENQNKLTNTLLKVVAKLNNTNSCMEKGSRMGFFMTESSADVTHSFDLHKERRNVGQK